MAIKIKTRFGLNWKETRSWHCDCTILVAL